MEGAYGRVLEAGDKVGLHDELGVPVAGVAVGRAGEEGAGGRAADEVETSASRRPGETYE